ncbi:MAG: RNA 2',3'-cyclic phosphodiesterase [Candidatus Aenigmarchaeota archaeon]|nr:RNA 2',3'-cyclic phosphodiesterase [Candidatus Aenigmarchaeota archaeon]
MNDPKTLRLFIALDFPKQICSKLFYLQDKITPDIAKIKWVEEENFHITLKFLGDVNEDKIPQIKEKLSLIKFKDFSSSINQSGIFPSNNYIKVIWLGLMPYEKICLLHNKIDNSLLTLDFTKEDSFQSHATLGRVKYVHKKELLIEKIRKIEELILGEIFTISSFSLKKSTLTKKGPVYKDIAIFNSKSQ